MLRRVFRWLILPGSHVHVGFVFLVGLITFAIIPAAISAPDAPPKMNAKNAPDRKVSERKPMSKFSKEITALVAVQEKMWNKGDLDGFLDSYLRSKEVVYVVNGEVFRGYDAIRARYVKRYGETKSSMGQLYLTELEITDMGDKHALCSGKFTVVHHRHVPIYGRFTLIFIKAKEGWKIIYDHSSV